MRPTSEEIVKEKDDDLIVKLIEEATIVAAATR